MAKKTGNKSKRKIKKKKPDFFRRKNYILYSLIFIIFSLLVWENSSGKLNAGFKNIRSSVTSLGKKIPEVKIELPSLKEVSLPSPKIQKTTKQTKAHVKSVKSDKPTVKSDINSDKPQYVNLYDFLKGVDDLYVPVIHESIPSQIVNYSGFSVSYNNDNRVANWVGYELTREETVSVVKRVNKFVKDPNVLYSATNQDYLKSGYDRGHLAPAADMGWSDKSMHESFYFSNMTPQEPSFNRGVWKKLEDKCREWAVRDSAIIIVTGPIIKGNEKRIGKNNIVVPEYFYKVILSPFTESPNAIAFLIKNEGTLQTLPSFAISVDSLESLTGFNFFHKLPSEYEDEIESNVNIGYWF